MDNLLGIGGESLVIRRNEKAFKIIPLEGGKDKISEVQTFLQSLSLTGEPTDPAKKTKSQKIEDLSKYDLSKLAAGSKILENRSEFEMSSLKHENIINYENVSLDLVNDQGCLIAGKFYKILISIFLILILVMPIYNKTLWEYLKESNSNGTIISMEERFQIFEKSLAGLKYIQQRRFRQ